MSTRERDNDSGIRSLETGMRGLDAVLGGGLPEYSFNLIVGGPGTGKTTLAQQIAFGAARAGSIALYFTVLGEPTIKMLRYQRQFGFFDPDLVGSAVQYINLSEEALLSDQEALLERIVGEVERSNAGVVIVDSFRSIPYAQLGANGQRAVPDYFVQRLALHLTTWEVTSFLIGEYDDNERPHPVFTVADGVIWLSQAADRNSVVRKLQVMKMRGREPMPGLHTFRITNGGIQVFPRIPEQHNARAVATAERQSTGVPGLDELMGGGIPAGDAVMLVGPAGSGKTTFTAHFIAEANRQGESAVAVVFEEYPEEYLARAMARRQGLSEMADAGKLRLIYLRPLDLSVDETLAEIMDAVQDIGATRVVIDSLSGFEVALAPAFREDFRESLYRLVGALTATGVTVFMTAESAGAYPDLRFTNDKVSFITDDVIAQRYVEIDGELRRILAVIKMRGSQHSKEFRTYEISASGAIIGGALRDYQGIMTGMPEVQLRPALPRHEGLTPVESAVLETLIRIGEAKTEVLAARLALDAAALAGALARLLELGYVVPVGSPGDGYRAVAQ